MNEVIINPYKDDEGDGAESVDHVSIMWQLQYSPILSLLLFSRSIQIQTVNGTNILKITTFYFKSITTLDDSIQKYHSSNYRLHSLEKHSTQVDMG